MKKLSTMFVMLLAATAFAQNPVTFQVHMDVQEALGNFDPATDQVVVRGSFNGWGGMDPTLTDAGDGLYTGSYDMGDEFIDQLVEYKFVMIQTDGEAWETVDNRTFTLAAGGQTLDAVWFDNVTEVPELINAEIVFRVNMEVAAANPETFDPTEDLIVIRGGHSAIGDWGGAVAMNVVGGQPNHYVLEVQFDELSADQPLEYKFVILDQGNEDAATWESVANRTVQATAEWPDTDSDGYVEGVTDEVFFDNVTWDDILARDVDLHIICDAWTVQQWFVEHPGEEQGGLTSYDDINYIGICGPWNNWPWGAVPNEYQLLPTTGTLWEVNITFAQSTSRTIAYKYGANGADNEAGFEENHSYLIDDSTGEDTLTDLFGYPYDMWFGTLDVEEPAVVSSAFELKGNYPNPFNPSTTIAFNLRNAGSVELRVFDLSGALVSSQQADFAAGNNTINFDGAALASGLYFYSIEAAGQIETAKMMLVK